MVIFASLCKEILMKGTAESEDAPSSKMASFKSYVYFFFETNSCVVLFN